MSTLRKNQSFWMLTASQFLGAFNDNAFRTFILLLALSEPVRGQLAWLGGDPQPFAMGLFAVPFVIFALVFGLAMGADYMLGRIADMARGKVAKPNWSAAMSGMSI